MDREKEGNGEPAELIERVEHMNNEVSEFRETIDGLRKTNDGLVEHIETLKQL